MRRVTFLLVLAVTLLGALSAFAFEQTRISQLGSGEKGMRIEIEGRGTVVILLHTKQAPKATSHIIKLIEKGFYDQQRFHRVEKTPKPFLVQVGDPTTTGPNSQDISRAGKGGTGSRIPFEETNFPNIAGAVGLAASSTDRNSGDSQFYMLLDNATFLDGNYTVFGKVISGMEVLKKVELGDRIKSITLVTG